MTYVVYEYSPLPTQSFHIRLLRLLPSADESSPIHCNLVTYPLDDSRRSGSHLYEAVSYVWGSAEEPVTVFINSNAQSLPFKVTPNLHAALSRLRDAYFERILWVDAICINQKDDYERASQVRAMARIYGLAQRVVVWLGKEEDESALALQRLREVALEKESSKHEDNDSDVMFVDKDEQRNIGDAVQGLQNEEPAASRSMSTVEDRAVIALLDRVYFRRMWILQELAAARNILIICGDSELQGTTFRAGLSAFSLEKEKQLPRLQSRMRSILSLLNSSYIRENLKGQEHLRIQPLADLIDQFYAHDATDSRDKIYGLLGLCSDYTLATKLKPDYTMEWKDLCERLGRFVFGVNATISASHTKELAFIKCRGMVLGKISDVKSDRFWNDNQTALITSTSPRPNLGVHEWIVQTSFRKSTKDVLDGDIVFLPEESTNLVIARPTTYYFDVVLVTDRSQLGLYSSRRSSSWASELDLTYEDEASTSDLPLVWNWNVPYEQEEQEVFGLMRNTKLEVATDNLNKQDEKVEALSNMAGAFASFEDYAQEVRSLKDMIRRCERANQPELLSAVQGRERLLGVEKQIARCERAKGLMGEWQSRACIISGEEYAPTSSAAEVKMIHEFGAMMVKCRGWDYPYAPSHGDHKVALVYLDIASKAMSEGVTPGMLYTAAGSVAKADFDFLADIEEEPPQFGPNLLYAAASNQSFDRWDFIILAKSIDSRVENIPAIVDRLWRNFSLEAEARNRRLSGLLDELGDRVVVTSVAINTAVAQYDLSKRTLSALLQAAKGDNLVSQETLKIAAANRGQTAGELMELLLQKAGPSVDNLDDVLIEAVKNRRCGSDILTAFVKHFGWDIPITEPVMLAAIRAGTCDTNKGILPMLCVQGSVVSDAIIQEARASNAKEEVIETLLALRRNGDLQGDITTQAKRPREE